MSASEINLLSLKISWFKIKEVFVNDVTSETMSNLSSNLAGYLY